MACDRERLLPLLADNELGTLRRWQLSRHVARCADCAASLENLQAMRTALRTRLERHRAPPDLAARIGAALAREPVPEPPRPALRPSVRLASLRFAGGGLAGALAGVALTLLVVRAPTGSMGLESAVIGSHVRSLMAEHLTDVATSDQHTVKPWLSSRLDVSPPVRELAEQGFPLVGGRLDYIEGHAAAAVVYRHAQHVINLFAWASPGQPDSPMRAESRQGFNLVTWRNDGMTFWAVSDLEADQLGAFARLVRGG
jgi:anti-sigma factor RsiW